MNATQQSSATLFLCLLAILVICLAGIFDHEIWSPDEPRVSAISLRMANTGDFVVPRLSGEPFVEKPPLHFIFSALLIKTLGPVVGNTGAIRFGTVLMGMGVLWMTFLVGRHLSDSKTGFLAVLCLGTMEGFVENFHWIRVDASLSFCVIAGVFCLLKVFHDGRTAYAPPAGIFMAGAFLSKGLIGPVFTFIPWGLLFLEHMILDRPSACLHKRFIMQNVLILAFFTGFCALWIVPFYIHGGDALWHEWFWVNQFGRFSGDAASKGHIFQDKPFYYLKYVLLYALPWSPLVFYGLFTLALNLFRRKSPGKKVLFLFAWGILVTLVLSFAATKRAIYLTPILPVFALISARCLTQKIPAWFKGYAFFWFGLALVLSAIVSLSPLYAGLLPTKVPTGVREGLSHFGLANLLSLGLLLLCLTALVRYRKNVSLAHLMVMTTAVLYLSLLGAPMKALDMEKNMKQDIREFVARIPASERPRIAGVDLTETNLGGLYYYGGLALPMIHGPRRVTTILEGRDPVYHSLIVSRTIKTGTEDDTLADVPYLITNKTVTGTDHAIYVITGRHPDGSQGHLTLRSLTSP